MRGVVLLGAAAVLAGCAALGLGEKTVTLAEDGVAKADIVIAAKPTRVVQFAAYELQALLKDATGADFPIVKDDAAPSGRYEIRIGESARTKHKASEFDREDSLVEIGADATELIGIDAQDFKTKVAHHLEPGKAFRLSGMPGYFDRQGSLQATYRFLEQDIGFRFTHPSVWGTWVPKAATLKVKTRSSKTRPFAESRCGCISPAGYWYWTKFATKDDQKAWDTLGFPGYDRGQVGALKHLFILRRGGGGIYGEANHAFGFLFDRYWDKNHKNFIEFRPELFAKGYDGRPSQPCFTSDELVKLMVDYGREYLSATGFATRAYSHGRNVGGTNMKFWGDDFVIEPSDCDFFCKCENCTKLYEPERGDNEQHSTCFFTFLNRIAKEIKKTHPKAKIRTLAYASHKGLPTNLKLEDNIVVYFCLTSSGHPGFPGYERDLDRLRKWHAAYPNQVFGFWTYNCMCVEAAYHGGYTAFPPCIARHARDLYQELKRCNASAGGYYCGAYGYLDSYAQMRYSFDPDTTAEEIFADYFRPFGAAAKPLRAFYDFCEERYCNRANYPKGTGGIQLNWKYLGDEATMRTLAGYVEQAEAALRDSDDARAKALFEMFKLSVWNTMLGGAAQYALRQATPMPEWESVRVSGAAGDPDKVDWAKAKSYPQKLYRSGTTNESQFAASLRFANDDTHVYVEIREKLKTADLVVSPTITCNDEIELVLAAQPAQPYRGYFSGPKGWIRGASWGEVNWRQDVPASDSGHEAYHAVCKSDRSDPDEWVMRYAFPLAEAASRPLKPGETLYMNATSVFGKEICGERCGIFTVTPYTTCHTTDRIGAIRLAK